MAFVRCRTTYLLAHAWWEDPLIAADVAGGMTIREALSAYTSTLYQRSRRTLVEIRRLGRSLPSDIGQVVEVMVT